jgi:predicted metal-dependent peptidase
MTKKSQLLARWDQLRLSMCWGSSFLAPALAALTLVESDVVPTAGVDTRGRVYVNSAWASKLTEGQVRFVILHECLHLVLRHWERRGGRDPWLFNAAADLVINEAIPKINARFAAEMPEKALDRHRDTPWIPKNLPAEEVYEYLLQKRDELRAASGDVGDGCGVTIVNVNEMGRPTDGGVDGLSPGEWKSIAQTVATLARQAGTSGGAALAPLLTIPPSKVPWQALLRELAAQAISRAGRDVVSWSRRSRRSPRQVILPGPRTNDVRLAIVIDSSGSMSEPELSACVAETRAAVTAAGIAAFLVVHDHEVRSRVWIRPGVGAPDVAKHVVGRGGTIFADAYETVAAERTTFAAMVHFTDGAPCDEWPERPRNCGRAVCALTSGYVSAVPDGWRIVPIEVPGRV